LNEIFIMNFRLVNYYFPSGLRWTWTVFSIGFSIYLIFWTMVGWKFAIFLIISSLVLFSTLSVIVVNQKKKMIIESFKFLWLPIETKIIKFRSLNSIRIDKESVSYTTNSAMGGRSGQTDFFIYTGSLEFNDNGSFEILSKTDWYPFKEKIQNISDKLNLKIYRNF